MRPKFERNKERVMEIKGTETHDENPTVVEKSFAVEKTIFGAKLINFRSTPSLETNLNIIGEIPEFAKVSLLETAGDFNKVSYNGRTGYVMAKFMK